MDGAEAVGGEREKGHGEENRMGGSEEKVEREAGGCKRRRV